MQHETLELLWIGKSNTREENVELTKELVVLRAEQAGLLGFESHAEYVFDAANPVEKKQISDEEG